MREYQSECNGECIDA